MFKSNLSHYVNRLIYTLLNCIGIDVPVVDAARDLSTAPAQEQVHRAHQPSRQRAQERRSRPVERTFQDFSGQCKYRDIYTMICFTCIYLLLKFLLLS